MARRAACRMKARKPAAAGISSRRRRAPAAGPKGGMDSGAGPYAKLSRAELVARLRSLELKLERAAFTQADELQVEHDVQQLRLEVQNEHLRETQAELQASRDRYAELYEFAPVAYLTIDASGILRGMNLAS